MNEQLICSFRQAVSALGPAAQSVFDQVGEQEMALAGEIRLRAGAPVLISLPAGPKIIGTSPVTQNMIDEMVLSLCRYSIYSHQNEMSVGYISVAGGHRAGVCGTAVVKDGKVTAVRDIKSICLRIARHFDGCSREIGRELFREGLCSAIVAGTPCSGKTTLLRDLAATLAGGIYGRKYNIAVVDERGELSMGMSEEYNLLKHCDVLRGYPKADGIIQAIRSLSPDVVICDEIGSAEDIAAIQSGADSGVRLICSAHAGSTKELACRILSTGLIKTGAFSKFVLLEGRCRPGSLGRIIEAEELYEMAGMLHDCNLFTPDRNVMQRQTALQSKIS